MRNTGAIILFFLFIYFPHLLYSQVSTGGSPISFSNSEMVESLSPIHLSPGSNKLLKSLYYSDVEIDKSKPFVFAYAMWANFSPQTHGQWVYNSDGRNIWTLAIKSENAFSLNILFRKFWLPPSGKLFIYNPDHSVVIGAFTEANNKPDSLFATSPIPGDEIIVEYSQDASELSIPSFEISQVNHDFLDVFKFLQSKVSYSFGDSDPCNVDITTDPNYSTLPQERSVCKILMYGTELCSGTMLANTSADSSIYFLTASHCLSTQDKASNTIFYYNYQSPNGLGEVQGSIDFQTSGATLVAETYNTGDFTLLKLEGERPTVDYRPYLSGWNRTPFPTGPYFAIHHPSGDVKKISRSVSTVVATSYNSPPFTSDFHWKVPKWDTGTTEFGSSGCGLFDVNGTLIGSLSGGEANCDNSVNDYFVRFNKAWATLPNNGEQLEHWLDPGNKSVSSQPFLGYSLFGIENCQRVSNVSSAYQGYFRNSNSSLAVGLYNQSPNVKVAEKFTSLTNKKVEGVYVIVGKGSASVSGQVKISFWEGDVLPQTEVYSFTKPLSYFLSAREKYFKLNDNYVIHGNVFVSLEIVAPVANDTLGCYISNIKKDNSLLLTNTLFIYNGAQWEPYSAVDPSGNNGSMWVDLVVSDIVDNPLVVNTAKSLSVEVYPVPANDQLYIKTEQLNSQIEKLFLVAIDGNRYELKFSYNSNHRVQAQLPNLETGIYILKIHTNTELITKKILIE